MNILKKSVPRKLLLRCVSFLLAVCLACGFAVQAFAADGNMTGGGSGMGLGSDKNFWTPGKDGVRVTAVNIKTGALSKSIDYSNNNLGSDVLYTDYISKMAYRNMRISSGADMELIKGGYVCNAAPGMPQIISPDGASNIEAIKAYFCAEETLRVVANGLNIPYDSLISGTYKIMIEPIAYFTFKGEQYALTATEAAFLDQVECGDLYQLMGNLTHKNLPLSVFLEHGELQFPKFGGNTAAFQSRSTIISSLGIGIVSFDGTVTQPELPNPDIDSPTHYDYDCDIDVFTSAAVHNSGDSVTEGGTATLTITGDGGFTKTVTADLIVPANRDGLVYFKWHTPVTPQNLNITVTVNKPAVTPKHPNITATVSAFNITEPPDPEGTDRNDAWRLPTASGTPNTYQTYAEWSEWQYGLGASAGIYAGKPVIYYIEAAGSKIDTENSTIEGPFDEAWDIPGWLSGRVERIDGTPEELEASGMLSYKYEYTPWKIDPSKVYGSIPTELLSDTCKVGSNFISQTETKSYGEWKHITAATAAPTATEYMEIRNVTPYTQWQASGDWTQKTQSFSTAYPNNNKPVNTDTTRVRNVYEVNNPAIVSWGAWQTVTAAAYTPCPAISVTKDIRLYTPYTLISPEQGYTSPGQIQTTTGALPPGCTYISSYVSQRAWKSYTTGQIKYQMSSPGPQWYLYSETKVTTYRTPDTWVVTKPAEYGAQWQQRIGTITKPAEHYWHYEEQKGKTNTYYNYDWRTVTILPPGQRWYLAHRQRTEVYSYIVSDAIWTGSGAWFESSTEISEDAELSMESWQYVKYTVNPSVTFTTKPDTHCYTSYIYGGRTYMKSGYGINASVTCNVTDTSRTTAPQTMWAVFPEFYWQTYGRWLDRVGNTTSYRFRQNPFSQWNSDVHFTPIWYPDETDYPVYLNMKNLWTPGGMVTGRYLSNDITIDGDVYDDWHIGPSAVTEEDE